VSRERLRMIEARDAELTQLMQDEEKLKCQRSRQRSHHQHARQVSDIGPQPRSEVIMMVQSCMLSNLIIQCRA